jgi:hypothetical protein
MLIFDSKINITTNPDGFFQSNPSHLF